MSADQKKREYISQFKRIKVNKVLGEEIIE